MQLFFYQIFLVLYKVGIRLVAPYNEKARKWLAGREDIFQKIEEACRDKQEKRIWIHCSSLGEFEQGRPVIESIRKEYPDYKIILTFFSPSGYEVRKDYEGADHIFYLPMDSAANAKRFLNAVKPKLVVFVKYEFWYHYLNEIAKRDVPALLISATFRQGQAFFKWYGGLFRKMLKAFDAFFVQDDLSKQLLESIPVRGKVIVSGDTRYDRVLEIAALAKEYPHVAKFKGNANAFIAGSTWPNDEKLLNDALTELPTDWKVIIAPHEVGADHIRDIVALMGDRAIKYSELLKGADVDGKRILIIDNIGMLSSIYRYGELCYIGGGFDDGIHNTLEPAVFGLPVIFGPKYEKYLEAKDLVAAGYGFSVSNATELKHKIAELTSNNVHRLVLKDKLIAYMKQRAGATSQIMVNIRSRLGR